MNYQKTRDTFRGGDCIHKRSSRFILHGLLKELRPSGSITSLTMPSRSPRLEEMLFEDNFTGCQQIWVEINKDIVKDQKRIVGIAKKEGTDAEINGQNVEIIHDNVFGLQLSETLDFTWLDLCSILTEETFAGISQFANSNLFSNDNLFAVTLMTARELPVHVQFFRRLCRIYDEKFKDLTHFRSTVIPRLLAALLHQATNSKIELVAKYQYTPTGTLGNDYMGMYAFQIH